LSGSELLWLHAANGFVLPRLLAEFGLPAAAAISYDLVPLSGKKAAK
jgi:hypothetical protein